MDLSFIQSVIQSQALQETISNILLAVVTGFIGITAKTIWVWLKMHLSTKQFAMLQEIASHAVQASEQGAIGGFVTDKKVAALKYATDLLDHMGLNYTPEQLSAAIEAAVLKEFNSSGQVDTPDTTEAPIIPEAAPAPVAATPAATPTVPTQTVDGTVVVDSQ